MLKKIWVLQLFLFTYHCSFSQGIGIGTTTPDSSAALDITHTAKGLLIPRMSMAAISSIVRPARGLLVYDSKSNQLVANTGMPAEPNWQGTASGSGWLLDGNTSINPSTHFMGTKDNQPLRFRVNNIQAGEIHPVSGNIFWGLHAGQSNGSGFSNVAIGTDTLKLSSARSNLVAIGDSALFNNSSGTADPQEAVSNTAIGSKSLFSNTSGGRNTATGYESLFANTTGSVNAAYGFRALYSNTSGRFNTAAGYAALLSNISGDANTAMGNQALLSNTNGHDNTATGFQSLASNTTGSSNTASGVQSLFQI